MLSEFTVPPGEDSYGRGKTLLFICSPSMGVFDSWAPVLHALRQSTPRPRLIALFLKEGVMEQFSEGDVLTELMAGIFDEFVVKTWHGKLISCSQFSALVELRRRKGYLRSPEIVRRSLRRFRTVTEWALQPSQGTRRGFSGRLVSFLGRKLDRPARMVADRYTDPRFERSFGELREQVGTVCFDLSENKHDDVRLIQGTLRDAAWFSLPHGIDLRTWFTRADDALESEPGLPVTAYAASHSEVDAYSKRFGLKPEFVQVVGVPRHDPLWVRHIVRRSQVGPIPGKPIIFLASRPVQSHSFRADEKIRCLQDVKRVACELGYHIVVRLHPKERHERYVEDVLGRSLRGDLWSFSGAHSYALGQRASFAITFFSSVAVDMVATGVPVIERCDFSGMNAAHLVRLENGEVTSVYRACGLVLGANNYEDLIGHIMSIRENREAIARAQMERYLELYSAPDASVARVAKDLRESLSLTPCVS